LFLFLSEKFLQGAQWNCPQGMRDGGLEFIYEISGEISFSHSHISASEAHKPCKVCAGRLKTENLSTNGRVEGLLLQKSAQRRENQILRSI
jgi:hypothetical protein